MSDFEKWFKTTSAYRMLESTNYYKMDLFHWIEARGEYRHTSVQIAFMTWVEQQAKIDELQKENAALVHVIKSRDIQLENEKHEYDELVNKLVDSKMKNTKLQKRVDAALEITKQGIRKQSGDYYLEKLEQALKGGDE